jgi:hypothetical protein
MWVNWHTPETIFSDSISTCRSTHMYCTSWNVSITWCDNFCHFSCTEMLCMCPYEKHNSTQEASNLLVSEERYWAPFRMPLYTFLCNLPKVLVQIANKTDEKNFKNIFCWRAYVVSILKCVSVSLFHEMIILTGELSTVCCFHSEPNIKRLTALVTIIILTYAINPAHRLISQGKMSRYKANSNCFITKQHFCQHMDKP